MRGAVQSGDFTAGVFQVKQARDGGGLTDLNLSGGSFRGCAGEPEAGGGGLPFEPCGAAGGQRPREVSHPRALQRRDGTRHQMETTDRCDGTSPALRAASWCARLPPATQRDRTRGPQLPRTRGLNDDPPR